jgi:hypothetical protein
MSLVEESFLVVFGVSLRADAMESVIESICTRDPTPTTPIR